jgi:hypothetical protein
MPLIIHRIRIVVDDVIAPYDTAATTEAASEVWVLVVYTSVDDADCDTGAVNRSATLVLSVPGAWHPNKVD